MASLVALVQGQWGRWWIAPFLPAIYALALVPAGMLRPEHVAIAGATLVLGLWPRTQGLVAALYPGIIVAIASDAIRFVVPLVVTAERIHGCDLRALDLALFAVAPDTTPGDWLQRRISPFWDVVFAIPYAAFLYVVPLYAVYLFVRDRARMSFYLWAFAVAHLIGFAMWLIVPAAPPWYIRAHGCVIDLAAAPSAAGLLRVDQLLGTSYFQQFYGRSANVFGAMPSLHVVFPLIGLLTAWRSIGWRTRPIHILYASSMMVASVYLDHHWIVDGLAGVVVAVVAVAITARMLKRPWP